LFTCAPTPPGYAYVYVKLQNGSSRKFYHWYICD